MKMKIKETITLPPVADLVEKLVLIRTVPQSPVAYLLTINHMSLHTIDHFPTFAYTLSQQFQIKVTSMITTHNKRSNNNSWQNAISCKNHGSLIQTVSQLLLTAYFLTRGTWMKCSSTRSRTHAFLQLVPHFLKSMKTDTTLTLPHVDHSKCSSGMQCTMS